MVRHLARKHMSVAIVLYWFMGLSCDALRLDSRESPSAGQVSSVTRWPYAPEDLSVECQGEGCMCPMEQTAPWNKQGQPDIRMKVHDARALQSSSGLSAAAFFQEHGFVLLSAEGGSWEAAASDVMALLFPGKTIEIASDNRNSLRGPGGISYVKQDNHQDVDIDALTVSGCCACHNACDGLNQTSRDISSGYRSSYFLNFWGPCGMKEPMMHRPLALADPHHTDLNDIFSKVEVRLGEFYGESIENADGTWTRPVVKKPIGNISMPHMFCRPNQKWYYYPKMTNDEFMVFTHFQHHTRDNWSEKYMRSNFHGSFENPLGREGVAEPRRSCERRLSVLETTQ